MDPVSISFSLLAVFTATLATVQALSETIGRYGGRDRRLGRLQDSLSDLVTVLKLLKIAADNKNPMSMPLEGPVMRCAQVCREFENTFKRVNMKTKPGIRNWAKIEFMGGDIDEFIDMLANYKSTFAIALGTITMHDYRPTQQTIGQLDDIIGETVYSLQLRLQRIDEKLESLVTHQSALPENLSIDLREEKTVAIQCLRICLNASSYTYSSKVEVPIPQTKATQQGTEYLSDQFEAQLLTLKALSDTRDKMQETISRLRERLNFETINRGPDPETKELQLQEKIKSLKKCREVCGEASEQPPDQKRVESTEELDSDVSVASLESFTASTMVTSATSVSDTAPIVCDDAMEIVNLLLSDQYLRNLLQDSLRLLQTEKVIRNFRRALRSFSQDLLLEAKTTAQKQAANFVGQRSRQISVLLLEQIHPSISLELPGHDMHVYRQERLRDFLRNFQQDTSYPYVEEEPVDEDSDQDEFGDSEDHPDLKDLREWLLAADAMQNLRDCFWSFLNPGKEIKTVDSGHKATVSNPKTPEMPEKAQLLFQENMGQHQTLLGVKDEVAAGGPLVGSISIQKSTENSLVDNPSVFSSFLDYVDMRKSLRPGVVRLEWICICSHTSYDDFKELRPGSVAKYAKKLRESGYVIHAQPMTTEPRKSRALLTAVGNKVTAVGRSISSLKSNNREQIAKPKARRFATTQCSLTPDTTCRWLHLCIKKKPNAKVSKLEPVHICKDEEEQTLRDAGLFKLIYKTWKMQRTWTDSILFKLQRIEFIKFSAFPDNSVDRIVTDIMPPNTNDYDFAPPPPLEMIPPIAADHLVHLLTAECTATLQSGTFYLDQMPKKRDEPLKFIARDSQNRNANTGYGLRFVETPDPSFIVTFLFVIVVVVGTAFGICWNVFERDLQGAWTIAAYIVSAGTMAVVTLQVRLTS